MRIPLRRFALLAVALLGASVSPAAAPAKPPLAGERVLWMGDSITQAGGYVTFVEYYLEKFYPESTFDIVSVGRSSETVSGLSEATHPFPRPCAHDRLPRALELVKPTVVVACYGMNDGIYHPPSAERRAAFESGLRRLIDTCRNTGAKVIILTPPPFDRVAPNRNLQPATAPDFGYDAPYEGYDSVLADFAAWELTLPRDLARTVDLHTGIDAYLDLCRRTDPGFILAPDAVHPGDLGHLLMAQLILLGLGVDLPSTAADLDAELARIQADPLYALVKRHRETRSNAWLARIGLPGALEAAEAHCTQLQAEIDILRTAPVGDSH